MNDATQDRAAPPEALAAPVVLEAAALTKRYGSFTCRYYSAAHR